jgi:uncharacterized membrane protein YkvI
MSPSRPKVHIALGLTAILLMAAEWILLVAGTRLHELVVGAASVLVSALFLGVVIRMSTLSLEFRASDVATGWRIPWYVLSDCYTITRVLVRELFTGRPADSLYRVSGFTTSKSDPRLVARRVLATLYTTASPNSIVIGIDFHHGRMLFHQIERASVSRMTRSLGAGS